MAMMYGSNGFNHCRYRHWKIQIAGRVSMMWTCFSGLKVNVCEYGNR